jgi:hypothetical protein
VALFAFCTKPPPPDSPDSLSHKLLLPGNSPLQIRSYGDITIKLNGDVYSGSADMEWNKNGDFHAEFYSPFGSLVGSVKADSEGGSVMIQNRNLRFNNNNTMDTLPFSWGKQLTFGQFIVFLTGRVSVDFSDLNRIPDSTWMKGRDAELHYKSGDFDTKINVNRKSMIMEKIVIDSKTQPGFALKMGAFYKNMARRIEFRGDDKNYISIYYEKIKLKQ